MGGADVQGFVRALQGVGAHKGVFITTSRFSGAAWTYAERIAQSVILIDGRTLAEHMIDYDVGVAVARISEVKRIDEDFFVDGD